MSEVPKNFSQLPCECRTEEFYGCGTKIAICLQNCLMSFDGLAVDREKFEIWRQNANRIGCLHSAEQADENQQMFQQIWSQFLSTRKPIRKRASKQSREITLWYGYEARHASPYYEYYLARVAGCNIKSQRV